MSMTTKPTGEPEIDGNAFEVIVRMHTDDAQKVLKSTQHIRDFVGEALDYQGLQEEIDYTLEIQRVYKER